MRPINSLGSNNSAWATASSQRAARPPCGPDPAGFKDRLFNTVDTDSRGGVDATELKATMEASPRSAGKPVDQEKVDAQFSKLDTDGSGDISTAEMAVGKPGRVGGADRTANAGTDPSGQAGPRPGAGGPPPGGVHGNGNDSSASGSMSGATSDGTSDRSARQGWRANNPGFADQVLRHDARASTAADTVSSVSASA